VKNRVPISVKLLCLFLALGATARSDDEASNTPHVVASQYGKCYAKSINAEPYGSKGKTYVYAVTADEDKLTESFDWFAGSMYVECNVGKEGQLTATSVVRLGPWARGHQASAEHLAIAFYFDGKLVKQYSTLDIAGSPTSVAASVSHYSVFERIEGYRWRQSNFYSFEVVTSTGKHIAFDPTTGSIISDDARAH
jgi:hypothetical protein